MTEFGKLDDELLELINKDRVIDINLKKSDEYVMNSRNQVISVRTYFPNVGSPRAIVFGLHGYSVHSNLPLHSLIGREFNRLNIAYVTFDFHGHGYSEGKRFHVEHFENLIDDVFCVIAATYHNVKSRNKSYNPIDTTACFDGAGRPFHFNNRSHCVPFFIMGQSMGGAVAIAASIALNRFKVLGSPRTLLSGPTIFAKHLTFHTAQHFVGCLACCPAIQLNLPPPMIRSLIKNVVTPLFPHSSIPDSLKTPKKTEFASEKHRLLQRYRDMDSHWADESTIQPGALSNGVGITFLTAESIICLGDYIRDYITKHTDPRQDLIRLRRLSTVALLQLLSVAGACVVILVSFLPKIHLFSGWSAIQFSEFYLAVCILALLWVPFYSQSLELKLDSRVFQFPLLAFHDPADDLVPVTGTQFYFDHLDKIHNNSKAARSNSSRPEPFHRLIDVVNGKHDLYSTSLPVILENAIPFIESILQNVNAADNHMANDSFGRL